MQDTGHPEPEDRRSGGAPDSDLADSPYPATGDQDPPPTAWPGVADIPSPQAERVPPWSAQHLSTPSGPSGWFAPGEQALAAQEQAPDDQPTPDDEPTAHWPHAGQTSGRWAAPGAGHRAWPMHSPQTRTADAVDEPVAGSPDASSPAFGNGPPSQSVDWSSGEAPAQDPGWAQQPWQGEQQQPWDGGQQPWVDDAPAWSADQPGWPAENPPAWQDPAGDAPPYPPVEQDTQAVQPDQSEDRPWGEQPQSWPPQEQQQGEWPQRPEPWPQPDQQHAWPRRAEQQSWPPAVWSPGQHQVEQPTQSGQPGQGGAWQGDPAGGQPPHGGQPGPYGQPGQHGHPGQPGQHGQPAHHGQAAPHGQPGQHGQPAPHGHPGPPYPQQPQPYALAQPSSPEAHGYAPPQPAQPLAAPPTAEEFAARRAHRPQAPEATMGVPALVRRVSFGMVSPAPSRKERDHRDAVTKVRRNFGGLRQITVVNPKGGAGKTVAALMIAMTFGQSRGGYVLAWDNNETQGTLGMRAQQDFHVRTVRDVLHDLDTFMGPHGKVGDLSSYVRAQGEAMFDVLASDESATAGEMLTAQAFRAIREVVDRFYKLIIVDTGNNVRAENWQAAIDATNQLVVTMSARGDSAETAARMLDHLEQTGRDRLVRQAISVVAMPASRKGVDLPAIERHFAARTRAVLVAPYEPLLDSGEPIRYGEISQATRDAWLKIAAHIAEGL